MLSELRAKWAIKQTRGRQLAAAIEILADKRYEDDDAMTVAAVIINANIGP